MNASEWKCGACGKQGRLSSPAACILVWAPRLERPYPLIPSEEPAEDAAEGGMIGAAGELVLPRRAQPQPVPHLHAGGDCGGCVLGGALGLSVAEVYKRFDVAGITSHHEMERLLRCSVSYGLADRMIDDPAEWHRWTGCDSFGRSAWLQSIPWFNYVRMGIDAGYYGLCTVDYSRGGGPETNHWVLICGARTKGSVVGERLTGDVMVSCSAAGGSTEWVEAQEFLRQRGGYDVLFVRPIK